jgi:hypothetical protein
MTEAVSTQQPEPPRPGGRGRTVVGWGLFGGFAGAVLGLLGACLLLGVQDPAGVAARPPSWGTGFPAVDLGLPVGTVLGLVLGAWYGLRRSSPPPGAA